MSKGLLWALIILGLCIVVIIFNRGTVDVSFIFTTARHLSSALVFLSFLGVGVIIGVLLK